jgi:hypothetical protein
MAEGENEDETSDESGETEVIDIGERIPLWEMGSWRK